jgi:CDP-2,3-bis-(O-geranylgeranyl)-sn-glycerol synthase
MTISIVSEVYIMDLAGLIIEALKFIFPAYCANAMPVLAGGGLSIDLGRKFPDGRPIFGENKTYRGLFAGLAIGTIAGLAETAVFNYPIMFGFMVSSGALIGDLTGAFFKRRLNIPPGGLLPVVDQIDFIVGAILFSLPFPLALDWQLIVTVLLLTPPIHLLTNYVAYKLGLKSNPW